MTSFLRLEWLAHSPARAGLGLNAPFGDDVLAYCTERMDPETTRLALAAALHQAKRNKAFENSRFIGLALDGTGAGRTYKEPCPLCDPVKDAKGEVHGSLHHFVLISVVGVGLTLPIDVEPYGPGDSEYAAAQRLLRRVVGHLGPRFADYVVGDGEYATAPFLHTTGDVGLPVVARLKENLPLLAAAVRARFDGQPPQSRVPGGRRPSRGLGCRRLRPLGNSATGRRCAFCDTASINAMAASSRPNGSPTSPSPSWAA